MHVHWVRHFIFDAVPKAMMHVSGSLLFIVIGLTMTDTSQIPASIHMLECAGL